MSPEDFVRSSGGGDHSPISSNENSRGSWNNGGGNGRPPWPRTPPESSALLPPSQQQQQQFLPTAAQPPLASGPRTPPMPPMRGARTPEGPGPRTPEGKGARTPETPPEGPLESSRLSSSFQNQKIRENVKGPSTPPDNIVSMTAVLEQAYNSNR